jgi:hypothetical protein
VHPSRRSAGVDDLDAVGVGHPRGGAPRLGPQPVVLPQQRAPAHAGVPRRHDPLRVLYADGDVVRLHDPGVQVGLVERDGRSARVDHLRLEALQRDVASGEVDVVETSPGRSGMGGDRNVFDFSSRPLTSTASD